MSQTSQHVLINGARLLCVSVGKGDAPAIVVLHGGRGSSDHRRDFKAFSPLADTFRVIAYDQRGFGRSDDAEPINPEQLVDDLEAVRNQVAESRQMILIGFSFGGMIALKYALKYPNGLKRLILIGTPPSYHFEDEALAEFERRASLAPMASRRMAEKRFRTGIVDDTEYRLILFAMARVGDPEIDADAALEAARSLPVNARVHEALYMGRSYDVRDRLKDISVPCLVISGENDWICPAHLSAELADGMPDAKLLLIPGSGHHPHYAKSETVLGAIRHFLS